jgi:O-antigen/teichoic acid export membrane protein
VAESTGSDEVSRDARDLRRGVLVNLGGYVLKLVGPAGIWLIVLFYGKEALGIFTAGQAALLVLMRVGLVGLDKALHWWVARQPPESERMATGPVLAVTVSIAAGLAFVLVGWAAPQVAAWKGMPELAAALRLIGLALVPMTAAEVLIAASLGKRRMEAQVVVKDGLVPVSFVAFALALAPLPGAVEFGLPLAFMAAHVAGLLGAMYVYRQSFRGSPAVPPRDRRFPREMLRYAVPMWGTELVTSLLQRIDVLMLAAMTDDATVGIYAVIVQIGNAMRTIRRAFDPIVLSIVSRIGAQGDLPRLRAGVSYATSLVILTQAPVYAFIVSFAPVILLLLGESFDAAVAPVLILTAFWLVAGIFGLQLVVVIGWGRSDLAMLDVGAALVVQAALLWILIPRAGLEGAAWAVGIATLVHTGLAVVQTRWLAGSWPYDPKLWWTIATIPAWAAAMGLTWWALPTVDDLVRRCAAFASFAVVQAGCLAWLWRTDRLVRPRPPRAADDEAGGPIINPSTSTTARGVAEDSRPSR